MSVHNTCTAKIRDCASPLDLLSSFVSSARQPRRSGNASSISGHKMISDVTRAAAHIFQTNINDKRDDVLLSTAIICGARVALLGRRFLASVQHTT